MLSKIIIKYVAAPTIVTIVSGCANHTFEREFLEQHSAATRGEVLRAYSLEDQYRIFRYGNDVVHPPLLTLADPIAERGKEAIPFLKAHLESETDDTSLRDILHILKEMKRLGTFDAKGDEELVRTLTTRVAKVGSKEWRAVCEDMLHVILAA